MGLPGVTPRQPEIKAIQDILESDAYPDSKSMARAVLAAAYEQFERRDWWLAAMDNDGNNLVYGLYGTEGAARKALEKNDLGLFGRCGVFPVHSATVRREFIADAMKVKKNVRPVCDRCDHNPESHGLIPGQPGCVGCNCQAYVKKES